MPDEKSNAPAKPRLVQHPTPAPPDTRTLSERAQDAASERYERLRYEQDVKADREADWALQRLSAATGEPQDAFERVLCLPDERGNWISLWWLEQEGFGFQVAHAGGPSMHVNVYAKCDEHGEYVVAPNIGIELADLGDVLATRDEWACPNCEPQYEQVGDEQEQSAAEMVGDVILRAVTIAVMGKLEADKQEAQAFVQNDEERP